MKTVIINGVETVVTDKHARRLVYLGQAELPEVKEEKKKQSNKADKTAKETK